MEARHAVTGPAPSSAGPVGIGLILERLHFQAWRDTPPSLHVTLDELSLVLEPLAKLGAAGIVWPRLTDRATDFGAAGLALEYVYQAQCYDNATHPARVARAVSLLQDAGIDPVLIKGLTVSRYYAPPAVRRASDIDLVVRPEEFNHAQGLIADDQRRNGQLEVDLHHDAMWVDCPRSSFRDQTVILQVEGVPVRVLDPADQLYVLCHHIMRHSVSRPLWLCDIGAALEAHPADFDWERFFGVNRRTRNWVLTALALAHHLVGARIEDTPIADQIGPLPGWLVPAVHRRWELVNRPPPAVFDVVDRQGLRTLLAQRWPEPISATVYCRAPFNDFPRLPLQVASYLNRIAWYGLTRMPRQGRDYVQRRWRRGR